VWLRATPSPTRSPCRWAGQSATCKPPANGLFALWANRRGLASQAQPNGQEGFYRARPCQGTVRLRSTSRAGSTTGLLSSTLLRPPPSRRAGCTPFHCAAIVKLTCGATRQAPCGSMVFHQTSLQTPCRPGTTLNTSRGLLDGSLVKNHVVLRTAEHRAAHKSNPGCARFKIGAQTAHPASFYGVPSVLYMTCPTSLSLDVLPSSGHRLGSFLLQGLSVPR